jgi:diaminohydroxyphosphoribosylaminopyrimidine deaminase/5-amino-6-(5-phosphoribosylamino)uracil reductase
LAFPNYSFDSGVIQSYMDEYFMHRALELARQGIGRVSPNPLVGCVIVRDGRILGEGAHLEYGGPHAEPNAIRAAEAHGEQVADATAYVTLEPHSHIGKTPPCSTLLTEKGIARCVIAMQDPYPEVNGRGIAELRAAGVAVEVGLLEKEARELNRFFIKHVTTGMPYVTLKVAQSLDGRSALANGQSRWITGQESQNRVHRERSQHDAVLVGARTAATDNPSLTVRHVEGRQPWRIVLDARLELPMNLTIFSDKYRERTLVLTASNDTTKIEALEAAGVAVLKVGSNSRIELSHALLTLSTRGIASILVEAGPRLASAMLLEQLVDELQVFIAPTVLGGDAQPSFGALGLATLPSASDLHIHSVERIGNDVLLCLRK